MSITESGECGLSLLESPTKFSRQKTKQRSIYAKYKNRKGDMQQNKYRQTIRRLVDRLMDHEANLLTEDEEVKLFQEIINSGLVWQLPGSYGRTARVFIKKGLCENKSTSGA